jgi:hypothetical protein
MAPTNRIPSSNRWWTLVLVMVLGLSMLRCSLPTDLGMPIWDVPFSVAFNTERYQLADLLTDSTTLADSGFGFEEALDGGLVFKLQGEMDTVKVEADDMSLTDHESIVFDIPTDTIIVPMNENLEENYDLDDMFTSLGYPTNYNDGDILPLPPGGGTWTLDGDPTGDVSFDSMDSIRVIHVIDGDLSLRLVNDTDIEFSSLIVEMLRSDIDNPGSFVHMVTFNYGDVLPDQTITRSYAMEDDWLTPEIRMRFDAGGDEQLIEANHSDALRFTMVLDTLKADIAEAVISPQLPQTESDIIYLDDDFWVKEALIDSGFVNYTVTNETDVITDVMLTFPRVFRAGEAEPYDTTFSLDRSRPEDPPTVKTGAINIAGMTVLYPAIPTIPGTNQEFDVETTITLIGSGEISPGVPDTSRVEIGQSVISEFMLSDIMLQSAIGVPRSFEYDVDEQTIEVSTFNDQEQLQDDLAGNIFLQQVSLVIDVENTIEAPMLMELTIEASNQIAGMSEDTTITRTIGSTQQQVVIDNISALANVIPDRFTIMGTVSTGYEVFGVPDTAYVLSRGDYILPSYALEAPLSLIIEDSTQLRPGVQEFVDPLNPRVSEIRLLTIVENAIPTGGWLYLMAGSFEDSTRAQQRLKLSNFDKFGLTYDFGSTSPMPLRLEAPPLDEFGRPTGVFRDTLVTLIPGDQIELFSKDGVFTRQVLVLEGTGDNPVVANIEDYLDVTVIGEVSIQINED